MKHLPGWLVLCAVLVSPMVSAANAHDQLEQCVKRFVADHVAGLPDRDELASRALVHCQVYQQAYAEAVMLQFLAIDVPPRTHARELALTQGVRAALHWANGTVDQYVTAI